MFVSSQRRRLFMRGNLLINSILLRNKLLILFYCMIGYKRDKLDINGQLSSYISYFLPKHSLIFPKNHLYSSIQRIKHFKNVLLFTLAKIISWAKIIFKKGEGEKNHFTRKILLILFLLDVLNQANLNSIQLQMKGQLATLKVYFNPIQLQMKGQLATLKVYLITIQLQMKGQLATLKVYLNTIQLQMKGQLATLKVYLKSIQLQMKGQLH